MSSDGADPVDLVCGDGNAQTRATDQQRTITLALGDQTSGGNSAVWVSGLVASVRANVSDGLNAGIGLEVGLDLLLVLNAGILRGGWSVGELPYEAVGSHKHQRQRRSSIWERQTCWIWVATELACKCINCQEWEEMESGIKEDSTIDILMISSASPSHTRVLIALAPQNVTLN